MRRHGQLDKVENDRGTLKEALMNDLTMKKKGRTVGSAEKPQLERSENDEALQKITGKKG